MTTPLLDIRDLSISFDTDEGEVRAVDHVSFSVEAGEIFGLVGESGCGKSVTSMSIPRLVPQPPGRIVSGEILFRGRDILKISPEELRRIRGSEIGVIFQEPMTALSPLKRVGEQIAEVVLLHRDVTHAEAMRMACEWLGHVGIGEPERQMNCYPFEMSGGMRQRVMIAMALVLQPKLIIADEPTTALDVTIQAQILGLMKKVKGTDAALLLITHDMGVIWEMCSRMAVMYASRLVEVGDVRQIFKSPRHPYTIGLMDSIPALHPDAARLPHIPGHVPSLRNLPRGCAFAPRCPRALPECGEDVPKLRMADGRGVACIRASESESI